MKIYEHLWIFTSYLELSENWGTPSQHPFEWHFHLGVSPFMETSIYHLFWCSLEVLGVLTPSQTWNPLLKALKRMFDAFLKDRLMKETEEATGLFKANSLKNLGSGFEILFKPGKNNTPSGYIAFQLPSDRSPNNKSLHKFTLVWSAISKVIGKLAKWLTHPLWKQMALQQQLRMRWATLDTLSICIEKL